MINFPSTRLENQKASNGVLNFGRAQARAQAASSAPVSPFFGAARPLDFKQAQALRFAGSVQIAPHLQIQTELQKKLGELNNDNDATGVNRSLVAEGLGLAQVVPSTQTLLKLTEANVPVETRISALKALGRIANASNYNRVEIGNQLIGMFDNRVGSLVQTLMGSFKSQMELLKKLDKTADEKPIELSIGEYLKNSKKTLEYIDDLYGELDAIGQALGDTNYPQSKHMLREQLDLANENSEQLTITKHALETAIRSSESRFKDSLRKFEDGENLAELFDKLPPDALRMLLLGSKVVLPDSNETVPLGKALAMLHSVELNLDLMQKISGAMVKGLVEHPDINDLAYLKEAVKLSAPETTAKAVEALAPYGELGYQEDIKPLLTSSMPEVRRAAIKALLFSREEAAKQNLLDLLDPMKFFETAGFPTTFKEFYSLLGLYQQTVATVAVRGDDFIQSLDKRAKEKDGDIESRLMSIYLIGTMLQKPFLRELHPKTLDQAADILNSLTSDQFGKQVPIFARTSEEKEAIRLMATRMGVKAKDPKAVESAMKLLTHPGYAIGNAGKERLLADLADSMLQDFNEMRKDQPGSPDGLIAGLKLPDSFKHQLMQQVFEGGMGEKLSPELKSFAQQYEAQLAEQTKADALRHESGRPALDSLEALKLAKDEPVARLSRREVPDSQFINILKQNMDKFLRPLLTGLLIDPKDEGTVATRALSAKILGLLEDRQSTDKLIQTIRDPFEGKEKWYRTNSHDGTTASLDGTVLRASAVDALGRIGDPKALDVMLDLLNEPSLCNRVVAGPLAMLAPAVNGKFYSQAELEKNLTAMTDKEVTEKLPEWIPTEPFQKFVLPILQKHGGIEILPAPGGMQINVNPTMLKKVLLEFLKDPKVGVLLAEQTPLGKLGNITSDQDTPQLQRVRDALKKVIEDPTNTRWQKHVRVEAANTLLQFNKGSDTLKEFIKETPDPNFRRHAVSALISSNYALDPNHPDYGLVKDMLTPGLGVEDLHARGITGKGVEMAIMDGGFVYAKNTEGFQDRVKLPPHGTEYTEHTHPTMVMTTAAGNGALKGVAPEATVYSEVWPELDGSSPNVMNTMKKLIEGKLRGENNIRVINNSWGLVTNEALANRDLRKAMKEFKQVVELAELAGIQMVFSAGNAGEGLVFPGVGSMDFGIDVDKWTSEDQAVQDYILDKVITVGASNTQGSKDYKDHRLAEFSSTGDPVNPKMHPTVVAPGVDMMVYDYSNGQLNKELVDGTSFSGPFTSGLLTDLLQVNPDLKPAELREILKATAVKLDKLTEAQQGAGEVNPLDAAVTALLLRKGPVNKPPTGTIETAAAKARGMSVQKKLNLLEKEFKPATIGGKSAAGLVTPAKPEGEAATQSAEAPAAPDAPEKKGPPTNLNDLLEFLKDSDQKDKQNPPQ